MGIPSKVGLLELARILIMCAWFVGLVRIWRYRALPAANQAMAAALAMVLSNALILFNAPIPYDTLVFFAAMAQLVIVISFAQLFELLKTQTTIVQCTHAESELRKSHARTLLSIGGIGVMGTFLQYLLQVVK